MKMLAIVEHNKGIGKEETCNLKVGLTVVGFAFFFKSSFHFCLFNGKCFGYLWIGNTSCSDDREVSFYYTNWSER